MNIMQLSHPMVGGLYMKQKLSMEECKKVQLSILSYVDEFCRNNRINYYLCGGTLLGAIRHKGYIPWDDDIDVMLPRPDYEKLLRCFDGKGQYKLISMYNQDDYYYPYAKIQDVTTELIEKNADVHIKDYGINIDIFPIDGLPDTDFKIRNYYRRVMFKREIYYLSLNKNFRKSKSRIISFVKYLIWRYAKVVGWKKLLKRVVKISLKYDYDKSFWVGAPIAGYGNREVFHKTIFAETLRVPFENMQFNIPVGYDEYLTRLYDDYMELPSEENRKTRHEFVAYKNV